MEVREDKALATIQRMCRFSGSFWCSRCEAFALGSPVNQCRRCQRRSDPDWPADMTQEDIAAWKLRWHRDETSLESFIGEWLRENRLACLRQDEVLKVVAGRDATTHPWFTERFQAMPSVDENTQFTLGQYNFGRCLMCDVPLGLRRFRRSLCKPCRTKSFRERWPLKDKLPDAITITSFDLPAPQECGHATARAELLSLTRNALDEVDCRQKIQAFDRNHAARVLKWEWQKGLKGTPDPKTGDEVNAAAYVAVDAILAGHIKTSEGNGRDVGFYWCTSCKKFAERAAGSLCEQCLERPPSHKERSPIDPDTFDAEHKLKESWTCSTCGLRPVKHAGDDCQQCLAKDGVQWPPNPYKHELIARPRDYSKVFGSPWDDDDQDDYVELRARAKHRPRGKITSRPDNLDDVGDDCRRYSDSETEDEPEPSISALVAERQMNLEKRLGFLPEDRDRGRRYKILVGFSTRRPWTPDMEAYSTHSPDCPVCQGRELDEEPHRICLGCMGASDDNRSPTGIIARHPCLSESPASEAVEIATDIRRHLASVDRQLRLIPCSLRHNLLWDLDELPTVSLFGVRNSPLESSKTISLRQRKQFLLRQLATIKPDSRRERYHVAIERPAESGQADSDLGFLQRLPRRRRARRKSASDR